MLFSEAVETSRLVAATPKRLEKVALLSNLLARLDPEEVEITVSWLSGFMRQGRKGIGYAIIRESATQPSPEPFLEIRQVDQALEILSHVKGRGSELAKRDQLRTLVERATGNEQQFLTDLLIGNLRQGALEGIMLDAIARAANVPLPAVRRASMMAGDTPHVARDLMEKGESALSAYNIQIFRPLHPMLAQPAPDTDTALEEMGEAALEYKLDGARIQAHRKGGEVRVYTRALNEITGAVPEIVEALLAMPVTDAVLDGEAIGVGSDGRPQPFQVTMRRFGRRLDIEQMRGELPLTPVWFDILYRNGESLIDRPQRERFEILRRVVDPRQLVVHTLTRDPETAAAFLRSSLDA
ncbi:MAG: ATP-dependent DNA ligase, partial [Acidobacteriota bacterium]|nr:ATP-dependent DNA ligase [Acidobacteriota bacterium]